MGGSATRRGVSLEVAVPCWAYPGPYLTQCYRGWVCPLLWWGFLQWQHAGAESDLGSGVGGLGGYSHLSAWLMTVNHLEGTVLCQVAFCESWLWFGPLLINPIDINWAPSVLQAWV